MFLISQYIVSSGIYDVEFKFVINFRIGFLVRVWLRVIGFKLIIENEVSSV